MFFESRKFAHESQKAPWTTGTILLVDANPLDLETYADVLQHFGHEVRTCSSYEEACHILRNERFDVVIIGQTGSHFAGREVLEQLHAEGDRVPSLVLSKNTGADAYVQATSLGAADCIGKPVPPQRLKHAVDGCLLPQVSEVGCP
jgi:DNA-binding NtrC family response regulator